MTFSAPSPQAQSPLGSFAHHADGLWEGRVEVKPGCLDRGEFRFLEGYGGGWNRPVDPNWIKRELVPVWDSVERGSLLHLLRSKDGKFLWILDGQHRITHASGLEESSYFLAKIYLTEDAIPGPPASRVPDLIQAINKKVRPFNAGHVLNNYKALSPWPKAFKKVGLDPAYKGGGRLGWPNVIRAYAIYCRYLARKSATPAPGPGESITACSSSQEEMLNVWLYTGEKEVARAAEIFKWWNEVATRVKGIHSRKSRPFNALFAYTEMMVAFILFEENQNEAARLDPDRMVDQFTHMNTLALRSLSQSCVHEIVRIYLEVLNWRKRTHLLTIDGKCGRNKKVRAAA